MKRLLALSLLLLLPLSAGAATLQADTTLTVSESPLGNAYLAGSEVTVEVPVPGDLAAAAGTVRLLGPIGGDVLLAAGSMDIASTVAGDIRAAGVRVVVESDVAGELAALAKHLIVEGKVREVRAAGEVLELRNGANGPVELYGASIILAGEFMGNVHVVASDQVTLAPDTIIHGTFEYNAPQEATIPPTAVIDGGASYIGSSSFLPTAEEARTFALAGLGIFFVVRVVAAMLVAGLVGGLFPTFSASVASEAIGRSWKRFLLLGLLGFGIIVATPILVLLLLASFVGIGIAALIGAAYLLLLLLSYIYAAALVGAAFARFVLKRPGASWRGASFGMLVLYIVGLVPGIGLFVSFVLSSVAAGTLVTLWYRGAFGRISD